MTVLLVGLPRHGGCQLPCVVVWLVRGEFHRDDARGQEYS